MSAAIEETGLPLFRRGKVRDTYDLGDRLLMVASDRLSAFDVVLPTAVPGKGILLNQLSCYWLGQTPEIVPNHFLTSDLAGIVPPDVAHGLAGRSMVVRKAERVDIECVVRGYLAGSGWTEYVEQGTLAGLPLPKGLAQCDRLPEPVFTPAVKHDDGHDENVSVAALDDLIGVDLRRELESVSLALYAFASDHVTARGLLIADTKFEFGFVDGKLTLIDEALTPDSSRYWDAHTYAPGRDQESFDKQFVRNWLLETGWDREPPGPELPNEVVAETQDRYRAAFERVTGQTVEEFIASTGRDV